MIDTSILGGMKSSTMNVIAPIGFFDPANALTFHFPLFCDTLKSNDVCINPISSVESTCVETLVLEAS